MKRIIPVLLVLGLAVVVVIQYFDLRALKAPERKPYPVRTDIDLNYHQADAVGAYYTAARNLDLFAREMWFGEGINVEQPAAENGPEIEAAKQYSRMLAYADSLGARLAQSQILKAQGFNNSEIRRMEEEGVAPSQLEVERMYGGSFFKKGDENQGVWLIQELLIEKGYVMPHDGYFWEETRLAVREFQKKNGLPTTGTADLKTLTQLLKQ